ncbi:hypothetical protein [Ectobacillus ponti]|uniref:Uncharacterized protein n=1 Tax=Ectobacillus ponti TaxID=2961894 RepID=A0AA41XBY0_9BACI|nr:hypothetical protein [Ectobacillus ponti]MCP8970073.1 hypothetical protein [Ectobacillus ponti]
MKFKKLIPAVLAAPLLFGILPVQPAHAATAVKWGDIYATKDITGRVVVRADSYLSAKSSTGKYTVNTAWKVTKGQTLLALSADSKYYHVSGGDPDRDGYIEKSKVTFEAVPKAVLDQLKTAQKPVKVQLKTAASSRQYLNKIAPQLEYGMMIMDAEKALGQASQAVFFPHKEGKKTVTDGVFTYKNWSGAKAFQIGSVQTETLLIFNQEKLCGIAIGADMTAAVYQPTDDKTIQAKSKATFDDMVKRLTKLYGKPLETNYKAFPTKVDGKTFYSMSAYWVKPGTSEEVVTLSVDPVVKKVNGKNQVYLSYGIAVLQ